MGGADRLDQKTATYMIAHRSKKWWWPIFGFCLNLFANNRLQIFRHQKENPGQKPLGLLGLHVALLTRITDVREKPPKY